MKMTNSATLALSYALGFSAVVALAFFTILGVPLTTPNTRAVGHFLLSANPSGIGIYQPGKHRFYLVSPYNDFTRDTHGITTPLLSMSTPPQTSPLPLVTGVADRMSRIGMYLGMVPVSKTFQAEGTIHYGTTVNGSRIRITRTVSNDPKLAFAQGTAMTITYSRDDFIFDRDGRLYTENTDEDANLLSVLNDINLSRSDVENRRETVNGLSVSVVNPHIPGVLRVVGHEGQRMAIDKDAKRIEIEEDADQSMIGNASMSIDIDVLGSVKETSL